MINDHECIHNFHFIHKCNRRVGLPKAAMIGFNKMDSIKKIAFIPAVFLLFSCNTRHTKKQVDLPLLLVVNYDTALKKINDTWMYKGQLFSGYMIEQERDKRMVYQLPIDAGKENGLAKAWYNTGEKLLERIFVNGKMEGIFKQWWPNGHYRYLFHFKNNQYHGTQMVFFPDGRKRELNNYQFGQPEGLQSTWDEAGNLISNYTIRDKKLYGVIAVKTCLPVGH